MNQHRSEWPYVETFLALANEPAGGMRSRVMAIFEEKLAMKSVCACLLKSSSVILFAATLPCVAQVIDPVTAAQQPVPGAGHHYIGMGVETVSPADGSVSFELPIQTPQGRELSFPFAIRYNSSAPFFIAGGQASGGWTSLVANGAAPPFDLNGWSFDLPRYTSQASIFSTHSQSSGCSGPGSCGTDYCWSTSNMSFSGFDGQNHPLQLFYQWPDPSNPDHPNTPAGQCGVGQATLLGGAGLGDYGILGSWGTPSGSSSTQPPVSVLDRSGTVYTFPSGPNLSPNPTVVSEVPFGALAGSITDRNGNQIVLSGNGNAGYGPQLPAGSYTDTLGRTIISWTGLGNASGDHITVSGLTAITVKWGTTTVTFPTGYTSPVPSGSGATACAFGGGGGITMSVVSEIDLPNGQKYSFTYGPPWGMLTRITFPDGGYVNYTWGTNSQSTAAYVSWPLNSSNPYSGGNAYCYLIVDTPAITGRQVSYDGSTVALSQVFQYTPATTWVETSAQQIYWTSKGTTVTTTDEIANQTSVTKYSYTPIQAPTGANFTTWHSGGQIPVEQTVTYQDGSNNTLETVNKSWADRYSWVGSQTIPNGDNSHGTTTIRCVDNGDRVLGSYEYDFPANGGSPTYPGTSSCRAPSNQSTVQAGLTTAAVGGLLRQTATAYHTFTGANILDDPDSVTVYDGANHLFSQTNYQYDQFALLPSGATTGFVTLSGPRGNATTVARWLNPSGSFLTTTYTYFDTGQVQSITDPCGNSFCSDMLAATHTTYYSYQDTWGTGAGPSGSIGNTNAYLTSVTYPKANVTLTDTFTWGYVDGLMRSHTGQNGGTSYYCYLTNGCNGTAVDPWRRLTEVDFPDNGKTNYYYTDVAAGTGSTIESTQLITSSVPKTTTSTLDGMGHATTSQLTTDPYGTDTTTTTYDGFGRVYKVTNPERSSSSLTDGTSTFVYDALGRKTSQVDSDGVSTQGWSYSGNTVTYRDENSNQWLHANDAFGRLIQVKEPNGSTQSPTLSTVYNYDILNNLLSVTQNGVSGTETPRVRTFNYDSLSRLLCASNPENSTAPCPATASTSYTPGTTGYAYDANGNVMQKYIPLPNSTAAGQVITSYTYDSRNRLIGKTSNDWPLTPVSCYQYDVPISSASDQYPKGSITLSWTQEAACQTSAPLSSISPDAITSRAILSHDAMGRVLSEQQCTPSNCSTSSPYSLSYTYDLAGDLVTYTNGLSATPGSSSNPLTFTQKFDGAARLQSVVSNWSDATHPSNLFTSQTATSKCSLPGYAAPGELQNVTYGNGLTLCRSYDSRLHITGETDTGIVVAAPTSGAAAILIPGAEQSK